MHWRPASLVLDLREWTLRSDRQPGQSRLATCSVQGDLENAQEDRDRTDADPLPNALGLAGFDMSKSCAKNTAHPSPRCAASPSLPEPSAAVMERFATRAAPVVKTS